jgi:hypothetical protein
VTKFPTSKLILIPYANRKLDLTNIQLYLAMGLSTLLLLIGQLLDWSAVKDMTSHPS